MKIGFRSDCIKKIQEQNNVTGKYFLKESFGRNDNTIAHKTIAFTILKKVAIKNYHLKFFLNMWYLIEFIQLYLADVERNQ
ncbi:hypothetical protein GCM10009001_15680 [Virgibacillus siamensis]|uniref:Uncharacterized protein n=1 Tax=Virgibacillus siamensis TaxID=480071 RepID=A0ABP3QZ31_9BACI